MASSAAGAVPGDSRTSSSSSTTHTTSRPTSRDFRGYARASLTTRGESRIVLGEKLANSESLPGALRTTLGTLVDRVCADEYHGRGGPGWDCIHAFVGFAMVKLAKHIPGRLVGAGFGLIGGFAGGVAAILSGKPGKAGEWAKIGGISGFKLGQGFDDGNCRYSLPYP